MLFAFALRTHIIAAIPLQQQTISQGLLGAHFGRLGVPATFDYVVVGGGTAGLALARRLAANSAQTVAVVEAGGFSEFDNTDGSQIPADAAFFIGTDPMFHNPLIDWGQETTTQNELAGRKALYTSGKTLGGGSTRNFMFYQRGSSGSYDKWAQIVGDPSYTFKNLLPYFQRSVHFTPPNPAARPNNSTLKYTVLSIVQFDQFYRGPVQVSYPRFVNALSSWIVAGLRELGMIEVSGFVDGSLLGYSYIGCTVDPNSQTRSSSETSFLAEALRETTNLIVYKSTTAQRVLFNGTKAIGVQVNSGGAIYTLGARKEVISSFRSPQLLMASGIGPKATLEENGIPLIVDRPGVGQNMWDHILAGPSFDVNVPTHSRVSDPTYASHADADFINNQNGILTNPGADIVAFEKLPEDLISNQTLRGLNNRPYFLYTLPTLKNWPDVEYLFLDAYSGTQKDLVFGGPRDGKNYGSAFVGLVAPFSRGNVTIVSNDTTVNPIINPNWFSDPRDQEVAVAGYKRARAIFATNAMRAVVLSPEAYPGANITTDHEILETLRNGASSIFHAAGTNAMGKVGDPMAVVDTSARVFGVQGLRVVDASAFPILPPGHPQGTMLLRRKLQMIYFMDNRLAN
ncbi:hypothetical protein HYFRA_00012822 [Hymenoscyphus fraxineus]|uniref:Glucose-methanol-choline oxidoreductase N-terminal domain-containing protein n=1 Tax=Hymenoscyphus fraxineus TaxID=746836 RepID=A0A9N9L7P0_9HELO|nr:hypothetical protein HYFRA_00012822 [Hymenoscyphus fraxineus]